MKPETSDFLARAAEDLADGRKIATLPLPKATARCAYFAAFHAAEAFIFERSGKVAKTHSGVESEFSRLFRTVSGAEERLPRFLGETYVYKDISDYMAARRPAPSEAEAHETLETAARFSDNIRGLLGDRDA